jgi:hypothetical protein
VSYGITLDPADKAFSQWVRLRDGECRRCHSPVRFNEKRLPVSHQASHFQGRRKEATRFEPLNVDTLCGGCHQYFTSNPGEHYLWQVKTKGQGVVDQVILQSNSYKKKDRKLELMYWRQQLKEILNG